MDIFETMKKLIDKVNYANDAISNLAHKIEALSVINTTDIVFLIDKFCNANCYPLNDGKYAIEVVTANDSIENYIISLATFKFFTVIDKKIMVNPLIANFATPEMIEFMGYFVNERDMLFSDFVYDREGNLLASLNYGIVDSFENYTKASER